MCVIAVRVHLVWLPVIPARDTLTSENIGDDAADGREIFGAVERPPGSTNEILKLGVSGNDGILGFGDAIPERSSIRDAHLVNQELPYLPKRCNRGDTCSSEGGHKLSGPFDCLVHVALRKSTLGKILNM